MCEPQSHTSGSGRQGRTNLDGGDAQRKLLARRLELGFGVGRLFRQRNTHHGETLATDVNRPVRIARCRRAPDRPRVDAQLVDVVLRVGEVLPHELLRRRVVAAKSTGDQSVHEPRETGRGGYARQAVLDLDEQLDDLARELVLRDPPARAEEVERDHEVTARRLERRRLVGLLRRDKVVLREAVTLLGRRQELDPVVELLDEVKDGSMHLLLGRLGNDALPDGVVKRAALGDGNERVRGCGEKGRQSAGSQHVQESETGAPC